MTSPQAGLGELDQALEALSTVIRLRDEGQQAFDHSEERQLATAFLWVNVGSALKQFCRLRGIEQGSSPFPGPIRMRDRLCYKSPSTVSTRILWNTCMEDTDPLRALLRDLRMVV